MNLKDFIQQSLTDIIEGVKEAQDNLRDGTVVGMHQDADQDIAFDVAVTTVKGASGGAKVTVLGSGVGGEASTEKTAVSRLKFTVPVSLPRKPRKDLSRAEG